MLGRSIFVANHHLRSTAESSGATDEGVAALVEAEEAVGFDVDADADADADFSGRFCCGAEP